MFKLTDEEIRHEWVPYPHVMGPEDGRVLADKATSTACYDIVDLLEREGYQGAAIAVRYALQAEGIEREVKDEEKQKFPPISSS